LFLSPFFLDFYLFLIYNDKEKLIRATFKKVINFSTALITIIIKDLFILYITCGEENTNDFL